MSDYDLLDIAKVAEVIGVSPRTVSSYATRARRRREAGTSRPGDFPPHDSTFGRTPVWHRDTIRKWIEDRPGKGVGGGRPWPTYTRDGRALTKSELEAEYKAVEKDSRPPTFEAWLAHQLMRGTLTEQTPVGT